MKAYMSDRIRNVAIVGHGGSGKTSMAEGMLFDTGATNRLGRVDEGNSVSDFDPDEIKHHISINLSLLPCEWRDAKINLIDVPGYPDFVGEARAALRVADAAMVVFDAVGGVEVGSGVAWRLPAEPRRPRIAVVNTLEREHADCEAVAR
ncbi:MAG: GTP-binding protein, partial [Chloroflexota bacterium]